MFQLNTETTQHIIKTFVIIAGASMGNLFFITVLNNIFRKIFSFKTSTDRLKKSTPRLRSLKGIIRNIFSLVIWVIATMSIMSEWGIDITPIVTGAGIVGLAIGFGSQTLVKDIVTGFFLLIENQFNIGDEVEIGGTKGIVKQINLRTIVLKDYEGTTYFIPNSEVKKVSRFKIGTLEKQQRKTKKVSDGKK